MKFNQIAEEKQLSFRFIAQYKKIKAYHYYQHIVTHKEIPINTNTNHDFLNALMWLNFPNTRWNILIQQAHYSAIRYTNKQQKRHKK